MKDPSLNNVAPNMKMSEDVILSSLSEENPFAEYMWMENEEEFNRQVRTRTDNTPVPKVQGNVHPQNALCSVYQCKQPVVESN